MFDRLPTDTLRRFWNWLADAEPGMMAAAVAFYSFFALVPAALAGVAAASLIGQDQEALGRFRDALAVFAPGEVVDFVSGLLEDAAVSVGKGRFWVVGFALLIAFWSASRAVVALQRALRRMVRIEERRTSWRRRLVGLALTAGAGVAFAIASLALVVGGVVASFLDELAGTTFIHGAWAWVRYPAAIAAVYFFLVSLYRWGAARPVPGDWLAAGIGTAGILLTSLGFGLYLRWVGLDSTFGVLGAAASALFWLYLDGFVILFGGAVATWRAQPPTPVSP